jgi:transposase-like protein
VGDLDLLIPKLRSGSFLPSILEPRRRFDQALYAVIMEAYIGTPEKADRILNPDLAEGRLADRAQARLTDDQ